MIQYVFSSFNWLMIGNILRSLQQIITIVVFSHFINPEEFGIFSIVLIFVLFAGILGNFGTSSAVIHYRDLSAEFLSTIYFFNIGVGCFIFSILFIFSENIAIFFNAEQLEILIKLISINFIIQSMYLVHKSYLELNMKFKIISIIETISIYIASLVSIIAVWQFNIGVYALILQSVLNSLLLLCLYMIYSSWRPNIFFKFFYLKKVIKYSWWLTIQTFLDFITVNFDQFIIGKILSKSDLGTYGIAYRIIIFPIVNISSIVTRMFFPILSYYKSDLVIFKSLYSQMIFNISLVTFPLMIGLVSLVDLFVESIFNDSWYGLQNILFYLAFIGLINSIVTTNGLIYTSLGKTKQMFNLGVINLFIVLLLITLGIQFGLLMMVKFFILATIIMMFVYLHFSWKEINLSLLEGFKKISPVLIISIIMGFLIHIFYIYSIFNFSLKIINLMLYVLVGIGIYIVLIRIYYGTIFRIFKMPKIEEL